MSEKLAKHYYMRLNSNGAITYLELQPDQIPKTPPKLGDPDYDCNTKHIGMLDGPGELAYRAQLTLRALQLLDPTEPFTIGDGDGDKEIAERTMGEGL